MFIQLISDIVESDPKKILALPMWKIKHDNKYIAPTSITEFSKTIENACKNVKTNNK